MILVSLNSCFGQEFKYRNVSNVPYFVQKLDEQKERINLLNADNYVDATEYLPKNFVNDASVDYTAYLQKAINENSNIKLPNFPVLISDSGLDIQNDRKIVFDSNSRLILKASDKTNYEILRIHSKRNIVVFSPKITGDRKIHIGQKGEWGMGISIKSSENVKIINSNINDCWGDGIYLGQSGNVTNKNIILNYGILDNNRRNAISVISSNGLVISNLILSNTNGTNPQTGLDFEPNSNNEVLDDIEVKNLYTFNNAKQGVFFVLGNLNGGVNKVGIKMDTHADRYSVRSIAYLYKGNKKSKAINSNKLGGNITLSNITSANSKYPFQVFDGSEQNDIQITVKPVDKKGYKSYDDFIKLE